MTEGIRKEKNLPERIARSLIQNEELFIQSLKIFANTSIVGSQGAQAGGSSGGPSGVGNYLRKDGDIMDGPIAFQPSIASIVANQIDIRKSVASNYGSKVFLISEGIGATEDELNFIIGGSSPNSLVGSEFPGQILVISPIDTHTITINNDPSGFGDATAVPPFNIRTPDGNPVVLKNQQTVMLIFDSTSSQWSFLSAVGASGGVASDSVCFPEKDSDDQSGSLSIVFDANRFCRMRVIGDLTITFDTSKMIFGKVCMLTVEILQDPGGGHTVTFADAPFENGITPTIFTAGNRYTSIRFYAYKLDATGSAVRIFAFDELQPFPLQFFDGFIQARLDTDQTSNLTPNKHLEFDLALATDNTIKVANGGGQGSGLFTNFEIGHLYQCECHYAIEGVIASSELTVQFFSVSKGVFFGSQGRAMLTTHALSDSSQPVAKGFFVADSINDVVEVRIRAASGVGKIIAGSGSGESTSYVVIKDCGVAGIENLAGNLITAPAPTGPEVILPLKGYMTGNLNLADTTPGFVSLGGDSSSLDPEINRVPAMASGKFVRLRTHIISNNSGSGLRIHTVVGAVTSPQLGPSLSTVGIHETDLLGKTFVKDDLISMRITRGGAGGNIISNAWLEVQYNSNDFWFYSDRLRGNQVGFRYTGIISLGIVESSTGPASFTRDDWEKSIGRKGIINDFIYYGNAPAGTGVTKVVIEVNSVVAFESPDLAVSNSSTIYRFDGVNIEVGADDLIVARIETRLGTTSDGIFGIRFSLG